MLLSELAEVSSQAAATSKRLAKRALLAGFLGRLAAGERTLGALYLTGEVRQSKLGVGGAQLRLMREVGPAEVAGLEIVDVDRALEAVAKEKGAGSAARRLERLRDLFSRATADEQGFLIRLILGELRQGALESLVLEAIAEAAAVSIAHLRRARMLAEDLEHVTRAAFEEGEAGLQRFDVQLFRPVQPMLADTAEDVTDALSRISPASFEQKLDGARVQVHKRDTEVRVYTRALDDVTHAVPEVLELVSGLPRRELIFGW